MNPSTTIPEKTAATAGRAVHDRLNRPLHDLRISVIDRCNFRCPYCMPSEEYGEGYTFLPKTQWLNFDEITRLTELFVRLGVRKIRITGGEPLLRKNIPVLIRKLAAVEGIEDLALTTNGFFLKDYAGQLAEAGLHRLTVSLDTLNEGIFAKMNGFKGSVRQVMEGIHAAQSFGFDPIKINAVIQRGINDKTILELAEHFRGTGHILRFIEFMDVGNRNHWDPAMVLPSQEIITIIDRHYPLEAVEPNYHGEVADRYRYKDGGGEIGFISSVSQPFCGSCTRARLSTDGKLYTCLFSSEGKNLREPLRNGASDEQILKTIQNTWTFRRDRYSEERTSKLQQHAHTKKIEMYQIGG